MLYEVITRGFFAGRIRQDADLADGDNRRNTPRFQGENLDKNLGLLRRLEEIASAKGCTSAQLALAWVV